MWYAINQQILPYDTPRSHVERQSRPSPAEPSPRRGRPSRPYLRVSGGRFNADVLDQLGATDDPPAAVPVAVEHGVSTVRLRFEDETWS